MAAALPAIAIGASILGTVVSAVGSYEAGQRQRDVSEANRRMAEYQAKQAKQAAEVRAEQYGREAKRRMAQMRAGYAVLGVSTTEGTPLLVLMETAEEAAKDELRIRRGGEQTAWGLLQEATIQRLAGRGAYQRGVMGAGASLLGGAARAYGKYREYYP